MTKKYRMSNLDKLRDIVANVMLIGLLPFLIVMAEKQGIISPPIPMDQALLMSLMISFAFPNTSMLISMVLMAKLVKRNMHVVAEDEGLHDIYKIYNNIKDKIDSVVSYILNKT